jgi:hypothetical protein
MQRILLLLALALPAAFLMAATPAQAATCSNTLQGDGHGGPWRTSNNGGTLHGNTLTISCPNQSTHWDINYRIQLVGGPPCPCDELNVHRSGNGDLQTSFSLSPYSCNILQHRTHVDNNITGGNVNMPTGGGGVLLTCGSAATPRAVVAPAAASCTHTASAPTLNGGIVTHQTGNCSVAWHANVALQVEQGGAWGSASFNDGSQALWISPHYSAGTNHDLGHTFANVHQTPYCAFNWRVDVSFWKPDTPPYTEISDFLTPTLHKTC